MIHKNRVNFLGLPFGASNFLFSVRSLWRDLVTWGRAYLVSRYAGLNSANAEFNRLYQIPHTDNMGDYLTQGIINYITYRQQTPPAQTE